MDRKTDFWVFGYASLMWSPGFAFAEASEAVLDGYHRSLCLLSYIARGTPEMPGLVMGLEKGGECTGRAFRVPDAQKDDVVAYLYEREMPTRVYRPTLHRLRLPDGRTPDALCFVADETHSQFCGALPAEEKVRLILQGVGKGGHCLDYLLNTIKHLQGIGIRDHALEDIARLAQESTATKSR